MAGYSGYSMSNNAVDAYSRGLLPASKIKKVPKNLIELFCDYEEWHHTSKEYNRTNFYNEEYVLATFGIIQSENYEADPSAVEALKKHKPNKIETKHGTITYAWWSGSRNYPKRHTSTFTGEITFKGDWAIFDGKKIKISGNNYIGFEVQL